MEIVVTNASLERIDFHWGAVSERFVEYVRHVTNIDGQHERAYDKEAFYAMLPQDKLVRAYGWIHGKCGMTCQFEWASGRVDARALIESKDQERQYQEFQENPDVRDLLGDTVGSFITLKKDLEHVHGSC